MNPTLIGASRSWTIRVAALVAILSNVAPLLPDLLAQYGLHPATIRAVGSTLAVIMVILRTITTQSLADKGVAPPAPPAAPPTTGTPAALFLVGVAIAAALSVTGCAALSTLSAPQYLPLEQAAVAAAVYTAETANHADAATQTARAAKINAIAKQILAVDQGTSAALADIELIANAKVAALNLPPADLLVAQLLVASLGQAIQAQLAVTTQGAISPQTQVAIADVCKWIITDTGG